MCDIIINFSSSLIGTLFGLYIYDRVVNGTVDDRCYYCQITDEVVRRQQLFQYESDTDTDVDTEDTEEDDTEEAQENDENQEENLENKTEENVEIEPEPIGIIENDTLQDTNEIQSGNVVNIVSVNQSLQETIKTEYIENIEVQENEIMDDYDTDIYVDEYIDEELVEPIEKIN